MSEVTIEINNRKYRMACEDGQESQLVQLGERFDSFVDNFKGEFGEIGDNRLIVMAGIAVMDALVEAEEKITHLEKELSEINLQEDNNANAKQQLEELYIKKMSDIAQKIEAVTSSLDKSTNG